MVESALLIGMYGQLRGHEILLADHHGTKKHLSSGREKEGDTGSYIIISLLEIFDAETVERYHLTPVASNTYSGIEVRKWILLLMVALINKGTNKAYMLQDE